MIRDILRYDFAAAVACNILVRIAALHRHLCAVVHRIAVLLAHEFVGVGRACGIADVCVRICFHKHIVMQFFPLDNTIDKVWIAVIDFVNAARLCKTDIDRAALDLSRTSRRPLTALKFLPIQRIVLEQILIALIRRCLDIVRDALRLMGIRRLRRIVCLREMSALVGINGKFDLICVIINHTCSKSRTRLQFPTGWNRIVTGAVVDLRRGGGVPMRIDNIEIVRINRLAADCPLAIDDLVHRIVARCRAKGILKRLVHLRIANIMRCTVTRVCIVSECTARTVAVATRCRAARTLILPCGLQCTRCDAVPTEDCSDDRGLRYIRDLCDRAARIGRFAVVGLRHVAHLDVQLARRDRALIRDVVPCRGDGLAVTRAVHAADDVIARIDDLIVVRILARELRRVVDRLLDDIVVRITRDILICIGGGRGVRRLSARVRDQV